MKFSIIIPTINSASTIRTTLDSIRTQTHQDLECIIVDSNSTDSTCDIVKEYQKEDTRFHILQNETRNIFESRNKGIESASGEIITILNPGDLYTEDTILENILIAFETEGTDVCYGDLLILHKDDPSKIIRYWKVGIFEPRLIKTGWSPPHSTLFITKETHTKIGPYNINFETAGDYEFMLRLMKTDGLSFSYVPKIIIKTTQEETSASLRSGYATKRKELRLAWKVNNLKVPFLFITRRILLKLSQYF